MNFEIIYDIDEIVKNWRNTVEYISKILKPQMTVLLSFVAVDDYIYSLEFELGGISLVCCSKIIQNGLSEGIKLKISNKGIELTNIASEVKVSETFCTAKIIGFRVFTIKELLNAFEQWCKKEKPRLYLGFLNIIDTHLGLKIENISKVLGNFTPSEKQIPHIHTVELMLYSPSPTVTFKNYLEVDCQFVINHLMKYVQPLLNFLNKYRHVINLSMSIMKLYASLINSDLLYDIVKEFTVRLSNELSNVVFGVFTKKDQSMTIHFIMYDVTPSEFKNLIKCEEFKHLELTECKVKPFPNALHIYVLTGLYTPCEKTFSINILSQNFNKLIQLFSIFVKQPLNTQLIALND